MGDSVHSKLIRSGDIFSCVQVCNTRHLYTVVAGEDLVIESKFDGERVLIHKKGDEIKLWSRNRNVTRLYAHKKA